jgi:hypothetical protein
VSRHAGEIQHGMRPPPFIRILPLLFFFDSNGKVEFPEFQVEEVANSGNGSKMQNPFPKLRAPFRFAGRASASQVIPALFPRHFPSHTPL